MKNENTNVYSNGVHATSVRDFHLVSDSAEELDFRLKAFVRAFADHNPNGERILSRARVLRDVVSDFKECLTQVISSYENI